MSGYSLLVMTVACFLGHTTCSGRIALNPFPFGTIGCMVSDVCGSGEVCTNDLLFGSCQNIFTRALSGDIKFHLERREISRLEKEINKLIKEGFTWKDAFTQCALQNTLLEFSRGRLFDPMKCEEALGVSSSDFMDDMNEEIASVLLKLLESGDLDLEDLEEIVTEEKPGDESDLLNSNKRDEIVQVHKYFDKSTGQLKRDSYYYPDTSSAYYSIPTEDNDDDSSLSDRMVADRLAAYYAAQSQLQEPTEEKNEFPYFKTEDSREEPSPFFSDDDSQSRDIVLTLPDHESSTEEEMDSSVPSNLKDIPEASVDPDDVQVMEEDEAILDQLLAGTIQPEDLSSEEQRRLQKLIQRLVTVLEETTGPLTEDTAIEDQNNDVNALPDGDNEANVVDDAVDADGNVDDKETGEETPTDEEEKIDEKRLPAVAAQDGKIGEEVSASESDSGLRDEENMESPSEKKEPIDSHSMYLQLSSQVDTPTGLLFIRNLTKVLKLPADIFGFVEVRSDNLVNLDVNGDPDGKWDAETIAKEALKAKDELKKMTGLTVVRAGVGRDGNGVEFKQDNRYFVLTFILVVSIAGIMVAVVIIYLFKRHSRSKQKLAQLTSNPDGNEVSKDYQDLCRQRMQGKSSEKPEPLHAASRIGSASESQVRSPSSRSSTSSWSEEPAATNMDISTGHIVLSYMEDHLKNQNRLDKEWEAVSSYMADPSSTKVATDQSNMRKNRFADILPYDHSRVVLSSNANVANSDFINASFITDHDPRNPAYICTQGPLPHTVADFWQMIWEQGSVVIVMLTKLAENGTGLCHRYWPEEGSDLYHIYEVHLVSEHIWCDDYLVRSFYLKNLQTNETRTVTQFHFLTWPQLSVPASIKTLLDFRRKVNKSFRGRSCPIVVHCSDGCGRSGTYCLIDMVLNKMAKGAKEIDMAATLEHIRDQRMSTVKTKEQFQFSLAAVAEEVHAILKALPQ